MNERVKALRALLTKDIPYISSERLILATEAAKKYAGEPIPIFRAKILEYVLLNKKIVIYPGEMIVGTLSEKMRSALIFPEYVSGKIWLKEQLPTFADRTCDPFLVEQDEIDIIKKYLDYWDDKSTEDIMERDMPEEYKEMERVGVFMSGGKTSISGHVHPNYKRMLQQGFLAHIEQCKQYIADAYKTGMTIEKQAKIDYWRATIIVLQAAITYAERYAKKAEQLAATETDLTRKKELLFIAQICRNVPAKPATTFREAIQFQWFIHLIIQIEANGPATGLGRFDVNLYPYYQKDIAAGLLTDDEVIELLEMLYIKVSTVVSLRNNYFSQALAGYPQWQILMIGGQTPDGNDACNRLSELVLEAASDIKLSQPAIALRVFENTSKTVMRQAAMMIQDGQANPAFYGDKVAEEMVKLKGGTPEEAKDWVIIGCVEPHQGGGCVDGSPVGGYISAPKCLELVLHNGIDPVSGKDIGLKTGDPHTFTCAQDFVEATKIQLAYFWEKLTEAYRCTQAMMGTFLPAIFQSSLLDGCIENGKSIQEGGPKYCYVNTFVTGPATVGDSIAAIDYALYKDKLITLDELNQMCKENFAGNERIRQYLVNKPPKFGNDDAYVDAMVAEIVNYACDHVRQIPDARGGIFSPGNLSQTYNVTLGELVGATPDGRKAFTALSDNASPYMGRDISGPTAAANSVAKMDQKHSVGGVLYNLRFDPRGVTGEKGLNIIEGVVRNFCDTGGEHIQINVVDDITLRKAQENPENYRDLVVRVAGYMAYFTELDKGVQDIIIQRTAHLA